MRTLKLTQEQAIESFIRMHEGATMEESGTLKIITYISRRNMPCMAIFHGKSAKMDVNYAYRTTTDRDEAIERYKQADKKRTDYKERMKAERREFKHSLQKGSILVSSWGYEQTNVNYYEVTHVISDRTVEIREIHKSIDQKGPMSGHAVPCPGEFKDDFEPKRCLVSYGNSVKVNDYRSAHVWDGTPNYVSWYA